MFANGPPWTNAGVPSRDWTRFGSRASLRIAAIEPVTPISFASTGRPSSAKPTTMRSIRARRSARDVARQRIAITSLAAVMSKPLSRGTPPCLRPPRPMTIFRRARSFMSSARFHRTVRGSSVVSSKCRRLSIAAASRLCAAVIAWKSPVNWRLIWSDGSSRLAPPPVAPPLRPKTGPIDGCRSASTDRSPILRNPWASPIDIVVFPSPAGVGVIAETRISLPGLRSVRSSASRWILALSRP